MKGAGVEIYPGSVCKLVGNGIHHCKDGVLIKVRRDEKTPATQSSSAAACLYTEHQPVRGVITQQVAANQHRAS